ncbi:RGCVC family protein [Amycolatopsis sp. NPDC059657]|uniref:RGCVC family protein n=1 Tax=Amycolatopsis sp. NPDC059657 TaxID=3346899 RepID=UPI00367144F2
MMTPEAPAVSDTCPACTHEARFHDVIAKRFCLATTAGGFQRGCVCTGLPKTPTGKEKS